jgi:DNA-binding NtrC family response regulator
MVHQEQPKLVSLLRRPRPARIMLLDDEASVRNSLKATLRFCFKDYTIIEFADGDSARTEFQRRDIDLLITDFTHPGLRGEAMLQFLSQIRAKFPVILSSASVGLVPGLPERILACPGLSIQLLHKPFLVDNFKAKVAACLNPGSLAAQ